MKTETPQQPNYTAEGDETLECTTQRPNVPEFTPEHLTSHRLVKLHLRARQLEVDHNHCRDLADQYQQRAWESETTYDRNHHNAWAKYYSDIADSYETTLERIYDKLSSLDPSNYYERVCNREFTYDQRLYPNYPNPTTNQ